MLIKKADSQDPPDYFNIRFGSTLRNVHFELVLPGYFWLCDIK